MKSKEKRTALPSTGSKQEEVLAMLEQISKQLENLSWNLFALAAKIPDPPQVVMPPITIQPWPGGTGVPFPYDPYRDGNVCHSGASLSG